MGNEVKNLANLLASIVKSEEKFKWFDEGGEGGEGLVVEKDLKSEHVNENNLKKMNEKIDVRKDETLKKLNKWGDTSMNKDEHELHTIEDERLAMKKQIKDFKDKIIKDINDINNLTPDKVGPGDDYLISFECLKELANIVEQTQELKEETNAFENDIKKLDEINEDVDISKLTEIKNTIDGVYTKKLKNDDDDDNMRNSMNRINYKIAEFKKKCKTKYEPKPVNLNEAETILNNLKDKVNTKIKEKEDKNKIEAYEGIIEDLTKTLNKLKEEVDTIKLDTTDNKKYISMNDELKNKLTKLEEELETQNTKMQELRDSQGIKDKEGEAELNQLRTQVDTLLQNISTGDDGQLVEPQNTASFLESVRSAVSNGSDPDLGNNPGEEASTSTKSGEEDAGPAAPRDGEGLPEGLQEAKQKQEEADEAAREPEGAGTAPEGEDARTTVLEEEEEEQEEEEERIEEAKQEQEEADEAGDFKTLNKKVVELIEKLNKVPEQSDSSDRDFSGESLHIPPTTPPTTPRTTGGAQGDEINVYSLFIKIAYLLFRIINSFILNYLEENSVGVKSPVIEENKKLLEELYKKFNIENIEEDDITKYYKKFTEILQDFEKKHFETIQNVVEEIKKIEQIILSRGKLNAPLEGNVKTIIKLRRTKDNGNIQEKIHTYEGKKEEEESDNSNYSFTLGAPEIADRNMYHRYLKYKNDNNEILISGYIFSDIDMNGAEGIGWDSKKYEEFSKWLKENSSNLIITLGLTGSGKSHLADKAKLIIKETGISSYEFNFNEEGGKWASLNSIEERATYSTFLNPQSSRSHLLQENDTGTVVDLAGAEDSFTFKKYIGKINEHITALETQEKTKTEGEELTDTMLYIKYYLQGHYGLLIREAFNRFKQIKNYWLKEGEEENIAFFETFIETLELYEEMFILSSTEITQKSEGIVLSNIDLTEIREFNFEKFEDYMITDGFKETGPVVPINLEEEIGPIVKQIEEKTEKMNKKWWDEGPTIDDFNKNTKYPIITSEDIDEMQEVLEWFNPSAATTPYHNKLFMYFYLRKLYGKEVDDTYRKGGGWNAATTFLLDIKDKQDDFVTEILKGVGDNNSKKIFDILKSVPNLKTEREGASPEEATKEADTIAKIEEMSKGPNKNAPKLKQWEDYFEALTSADKDTIKGDAMNIIKNKDITYNSILGRIIRDHLNKKISSKNLQKTQVDGVENDNNEIKKKLRHCYLLLVNYFNRIYEGYMINKTLKELEIRAKAKNRKPKLPFGYEYGESSLVELFCYDYLNPTKPNKDNLIQSTFLDKKYEVEKGPTNMKNTIGNFLDSQQKNLSIILAIDTNKEKGENEILNSEKDYNDTIYNGIRNQLKLYKTREAMLDLYDVFEETLVKIFNITIIEDIEDFKKPLEKQKSMKLSPMELTNVLSTGLLKPYSLKNSGLNYYFYRFMYKNFIPGALLPDEMAGGRSNKIINQNIRVKELNKLKKLYKALNKK